MSWASSLSFRKISGILLQCFQFIFVDFLQGKRVTVGFPLSKKSLPHLFLLILVLVVVIVILSATFFGLVLLVIVFVLLFLLLAFVFLLSVIFFFLCDMSLRYKFPLIASKSFGQTFIVLFVSLLLLACK